MTINFIIDSPYHDRYTITNTNEGVTRIISKDIAQAFLDDEQTFISSRAENTLRALDTHEVNA